MSPAARGGRLLVVSNRLPLTLRRSGEGWRAERSSGGLVTALSPLMRRAHGLWLGWPGEPPDDADAGRAALLQRWESKHGFAAVDLPAGVAQRFYHGYPNRCLWPLFHSFPSRLDFEPEMWDAYVEGNRRFRDALLERLEPGDRVWVHDYQLMLLPQLLREAAPDATIGYFLHIPFPPSDLLRMVPHSDELLEGLLGADYVAFQTHRHLQNFRSSLIRILGLPSQMDRVEVHGRTAHLDALPIGIVPDEFTSLLDDDADVARAIADLRHRYAGRRIALAVDRLDYTKGIAERLRAFRRLLHRTPHLRGVLVLLQVAVPSRERIGRYKQLAREVNELVGEINGHFATPDWTPVIYLRRALPRAELVALYAVADVGWVAPLQDGMNLVAKEYVACQRGGPGVLLLSEFAGAAAEMGEAFLVNPHDEERTAATLERALSLPEAQRRERMAALYARVTRHNAFAWGERFLANLERAAADREHEVPELPAPLPAPAAVAAYRAAHQRLLLFDFDGTLVPFALRPQEVAAPPELIDLLGRLAACPGDRVVVLSGRTAASLEARLAGVPGLWLAAEHGAQIRLPGEDWQPVRPGPPSDWKERIRPLLERYVDRAPGSFLEEKQHSLVWHHRMADPEFGDWLAHDLLSNLAELVASTELIAMRGRKSVEVREVWAHKAEVLRQLELGLTPDFRLAIADDRTDEDLFAQLPPEAWTIHVGEGPSRARYRLDGTDAVRALLESLIQS